jgi:hypothetical protein
LLCSTIGNSPQLDNAVRKGTSDLLLKLGAKPLAESGVKIYELFDNEQP